MSVHTGKNCALCLVYPRPQAQFFPIRTSRLVNNIYLCSVQCCTCYNNNKMKNFKKVTIIVIITGLIIADSN